jgi:hypothetical protein
MSRDPVQPSSRKGFLLTRRLTWITAALAMFTCVGALQATTLLFTGPGADIAGVNDDGSPGITVLTIPVSDPRSLFAFGNNVTVSFTGLQHPFAGDLVFTLSLVVGGTDTASADVFNRIGKLSADASDFGYLTQFGHASGMDSGNYVFNSGFTGPMADLWGVAAPLGTSDSIPSGHYWPTTAFSNAVGNLSSAFNGLPIAGTWRLTISDYGPLTTEFTPGLLSWELAFNVVSEPEPATGILVGTGFAVWLGIWKRRKGEPRQA